jgi:hypothetical protein
MAMTPPFAFDTNQLQAAPMRRLAAYWLSKCAASRLPRRADIRPEEIRGDLPHVYLVDVLSNPLGFRFRLVGTQVTVLSGKNYTDAMLNEAEYGPNWQVIFKAYREVAVRAAPAAAALYAPWLGRGFQYYERFLGPLSDDGRAVTMIFGALHTIEPPPASAEKI